MPPENGESRPWAGTGSHNVTSPEPKIAHSGGRARVPSAYVSLWSPTARRRLWWYSYRCPDCSEYQFGRARDLDKVAGLRRGRCRHQVNIVIARVYGQERAA